jgi:hypothetical protein
VQEILKTPAGGKKFTPLPHFLQSKLYTGESSGNTVIPVK